MSCGRGVSAGEGSNFGLARPPNLRCSPLDPAVDVVAHEVSHGYVTGVVEVAFEELPLVEDRNHLRLFPGKVQVFANQRPQFIPRQLERAAPEHVAAFRDRGLQVRRDAGVLQPGGINPDHASLVKDIVVGRHRRPQRRKRGHYKT